MAEEKIPHYVNDPVINRLTAPQNKLVRPRISYPKAALTVLGTAASTVALSFLLSAIFRLTGAFGFGEKDPWDAFISVYPLLQLAVFILCLRFIMIWFIRLYQRYAKPETRLRCCYTPSCSEYAILALKKYGVLIGGVKAWGRLKRCSPPGGIDYP